MYSLSKGAYFFYFYDKKVKMFLYLINLFNSKYNFDTHNQIATQKNHNFLKLNIKIKNIELAGLNLEYHVLLTKTGISNVKTANTLDTQSLLLN